MTDSKKSLHVKTGDRVIITAGKDKGKTGNIKKSMPSEGKVMVEGVNMITKATKANPAYGIQGGLIKKEAPIDSSNVMIVCPSCGKPTRVKHAEVNGKKVRVCKKCGAPYHVENMKPIVDGVCDLCGGELIQRPDDNEEALITRLEIYTKQTKPLLDYYEKKGLLNTFSGSDAFELYDKLIAFLGE